MGLDQAGQIPDDDSIPDSAVLLRRVQSMHWFPQRPKPLSPGAFSDNGPGMSVFVSERLVGLGGSPEDAIADHAGFGLVTLTAGDIRREGFGIAFTPYNETPLGQSHADVYCKKLDSKKKHLRDACQVVVEPALNAPGSGLFTPATEE